MTAWVAIPIALASMAFVMAALWWVQRRRGVAGIVDVAWSFGTGLCAVCFAAVATGDGWRRVAIGLMAGLWGARLGAHLWSRLRREGEDGRYRMMRERWGDRTQRNLFIFFQIQATWAVLFALPMYVAAMNPTAGWRWLDTLGVVIWAAALTGEWIADRQLARFKTRSAAGAVCDEGLWRYSRHPNYFFEWLHWWAYVPIAFGGPWWWLSVLGPAVMYLFVTRVTGIPPTEARALRTRGEAYRRYQRSTNAFFPGPPRTERGSTS